MRTTLTLAVLCLCGCALRPRYGDFVKKDTPGPNVQLRLVGPLGAGVGGVTVEPAGTSLQVALTPPPAALPAPAVSADPTTADTAADAGIWSAESHPLDDHRSWIHEPAGT
ncbi:MAG: hypothetical protein H6Q89_5080, partial [Myxococcaceae bacterium]|nr:hypothetical protein [Myxococcaceae bacterium]